MTNTIRHIVHIATAAQATRNVNPAKKKIIEKIKKGKKVKELLNKAIDTYGIEEQLLQTVEECAELIQAINKWRRTKDLESTKDAVEHLAEEAADVIIMLEQIKIMVGEPKMNWWIDFKLQRLAERLEAK